MPDLSTVKAQQCDVFILGSGLAGSISAACLARQGAKVVIVDTAQHPRFAVGESMTSQLVAWLNILRARFDVPEIGHLLDVKSVAKHIGPMHGQKHNFGFVKHEPGKEPRPDETNMFVIPKIVARGSHLFRQDTDQYFFNIAVKYGSVARQNWRAVDVDIDDDGVTITGHNGEVFRARYLIDAGGFRSPLAQKFDLRDEPTRLKHHARGMFTHYIGVKPFDEVSRHPASAQPPVPWHNGTLHHLIDRGWFWIIPFDNIEGSCNLMCSVGLTIDERRYPKPENLTAEQEFQSFLDQYPAVKRQLTDAKRVREWVSAGRLQYASKRSVGPRWCLMSHASGFIDPLYSRGLSNTFEVVHAVCTRILESLKDDDWSMERYEYVDTLERGLIQYNDELVNNSYISFSHYRLWNAVFRVWGSFITPAGMRLNRAAAEYERDGDERHLRALEDCKYPGLSWPETEYKDIFDLTTKSCEAYEAGQLTGDEAADAIFAALKECDHLDDIFGWKDESHRFVYPTTGAMAKYVHWAVRKTPDPELRTISRALLGNMVKKGQRPR